MEFSRLREAIDRLAGEVRRDRETRAFAQPPLVHGFDEPVVLTTQPKVVVFPNKQDNVSSEFQIGAGDNLFDFSSGRVDYIDSASGRQKEFNMGQLAVVRSILIACDQPVSVNIPRIGQIALKGDDQLLAEHQAFGSFTITATRNFTGIRLIASDAPILGVELAKTVNARKIAGFDGKTFTQELTTALSSNFAPAKEFAVLEVSGAFDVSYTGTLTLTKISRLGSAYDVRRLVSTLTGADDFFWSPEPEWVFEKNDSLTVALTAQAGSTVSGEAITDDR